MPASLLPGSLLGSSYRVGDKVSSGWFPGAMATISQGFGTLETVLGINAPHTGIDFALPTGTVLAMPAGVAGHVVSAGNSGDGFGNKVVVQLTDGTTVLLGHMLDVAVTMGQAVNPGDVLGHVDSTGASTGSHVHFEVKQGGGPVDPWRWVTDAVGAAAGAGAGAAGGALGLGNVDAFFKTASGWVQPGNLWKLGLYALGGALVAAGLWGYFFREPTVNAAREAAPLALL